ncbi:DUF6625 family protein [Puia dinghuensis]|uniref:Uncharacterized protein n=1 Tax=Puia dinghuensis TaxID=1792502 RepID=A0A8J2UFX6_9BACT|nr:DUF6625 family protein [Puia dinghuensis]GGB11565.1 hypothetical protein GCM10011511_39000 [Puia dinghuensis]
MEPKNKIVVLICYYGEFPWYFSYFLHSCKYNPSIDFRIFSDIAHDFDLPPNVVIIKKSIEELKALASKKLNFTVNIDHPYKLCDFKPAYGLIFEDYTHGYQFWCQSDIDVIYGDVRNFMTDEFLDQYDFISLRHDYTTGCFALYRNTPRMKRLFMKSKDYETVFSSEKHYCFDECNFVWDELTHSGKTIFEVETEIESFTHIVKAAERDKEIRAHFDFILLEGLIGRIRFHQGKLIYKKVFEGILYHLYWLKRVYNPKTAPKSIPDTYLISPTRIYVK